jgi:RHS repeat-associated protein
MIRCGSISLAQRPEFVGDFTGKERDKETGLDYFGARYYSGAPGLSTSPDEPLVKQARSAARSGAPSLFATAVLAQQFRHLLVALFLRHTQRRLAVLIFVIDIGIVGQQQFRHLLVAVLRRYVQR